MPPPSKFGETSDSELSSIERSRLITPSDDDLPFMTRAILVDSAGTVNVVYNEKKREDPTVNEEDSPYLAAGIWHPMKVIKIRAGGTAGNVHIGE